MGLAGKRLEREHAAFARRASRNRALDRRAFVGNRVPFAAGVTSALPAPINGAAVLADKGGSVLGHVRLNDRNGGSLWNIMEVREQYKNKLEIGALPMRGCTLIPEIRRQSA